MQQSFCDRVLFPNDNERKNGQNNFKLLRDQRYNLVFFTPNSLKAIKNFPTFRITSRKCSFHKVNNWEYQKKLFGKEWIWTISVKFSSPDAILFRRPHRVVHPPLQTQSERDSNPELFRRNLFRLSRKIRKRSTGWNPRVDGSGRNRIFWRQNEDGRKFSFEKDNKWICKAGGDFFKVRH